MSNRSLPVTTAFLLSFLVLGACSTGTPVTGGAARYFVVAVLVLVASLFLYIAITKQGLQTIWAVFPPVEEKTERVLLGLVGGSMLAVSLYVIVPGEPSSTEEEVPAQALGTTETEEPSPSPPPPPPTGPALTVTDLDDSSQWVGSDVFLIDGRGGSTRLGETAGDGDFMILPEHRCVAGSMIEVRPHREYGSGTRDCPVDDDARIDVVRLEYLENLRANAAALEDRGMYNIAALVYNELAARSSGSEADEAEAETYRMVAMAEAVQFGGAEPALNDEGGIGDGLFDAIRSFQRRNGLSADGILGYATLERLAHDPIEPYISGRPAIPAVEPE